MTGGRNWPSMLPGSLLPDSWCDILTGWSRPTTSTVKEFRDQTLAVTACSSPNLEALTPPFRIHFGTEIGIRQ